MGRVLYRYRRGAAGEELCGRRSVDDVAEGDSNEKVVCGEISWGGGEMGGAAWVGIGWLYYNMTEWLGTNGVWDYRGVECPRQMIPGGLKGYRET